jgi:pyrroloquinoline quinone (PQQ) biosynthesis protein C
MNPGIQPFREKLRRFQGEHPLFQGVHPFWRECFHGRLSPADVRAWALEAYPIVRDFSRLYTHVAAKCESEQTMTFLAETIYEETGSGVEAESHPTLFRNLMRALEVPEDEILHLNPTETGRAAWEFCWETARHDSFLSGLTLVGIGIERPLPNLFQLLARAFQRYYVKNAEAVKFFVVHTVADVKHSQIAARVISELAQSAAAQARVREVLFQFWDLQKRQLDELYRASQCRPHREGVRLESVKSNKAPVEALAKTS